MRPSVPGLAHLGDQVEKEMLEHILPYWLNRSQDNVNGGFVGRIDNEGVPDTMAHKGVILNSRILWTFSAAWRTWQHADMLLMADRAFHELLRHFKDPANGGYYWMVTSTGAPADNTKYLYAQAFVLYALSEYARIRPESKALLMAQKLFETIEKYGYSTKNNGYHEVFHADWNPVNGVPLGTDPLASKHSLNTHLHLMEAYTNLYRIWPDARLRTQLENLVRLHVDTMYCSKTGHFLSYFDHNWQPTSQVYSYGHDIETAWLLTDTAEVLEHGPLLDRTTHLACKIADITIEEGLDKTIGGLYNSGEEGRPVDRNKQWWSQAEAIAGFARLARHDDRYLLAAEKTWHFVQRFVVDRIHGEWYFLVNAAGHPFKEYDKIGPWKCPYHTVRSAIVLRALHEPVTG